MSTEAEAATQPATSDTPTSQAQAKSGPPPLTKRQRDVLEVVRFAVKNRGYPPSMREIGDAVGLGSPSSVKHQLDALARLGYIRRDPNRPRAMEIVSPAPGEQEEAGEQAPVDESLASVTPLEPHRSGEVIDVPLVGRIAAGGPILAEQHVEDTPTLPRDLVGGGELFLLDVVGDSMIDAAICDGDKVVVRRQQVANNGDIVAALIDGEATVKVFSHRDGELWLLPCNENYAPIDGREATVMGRVVTVLRSL